MLSHQNLDWKEIHQASTIVDLHAHPSLKVTLFNRMLTARFKASRSFDPFGVRTDFPKLLDGGVDVLLSIASSMSRGSSTSLSAPTLTALPTHTMISPTRPSYPNSLNG